MPFGQSIPFAELAGGIAGIVAGEITRRMVADDGYGETAQRVYAGIAHTVANTTIGLVVNAALGADITGATVKPVTAIGLGLTHAFLTGTSDTPQST